MSIDEFRRPLCSQPSHDTLSTRVGLGDSAGMYIVCNGVLQETADQDIQGLAEMLWDRGLSGPKTPARRDGCRSRDRNRTGNRSMQHNR